MCLEVPPGEGNGYLLQYSCLENAMGRGALWTAVQLLTMFPTLYILYWWFICFATGNGYLSHSLYDLSRIFFSPQFSFAHFWNVYVLKEEELWHKSYQVFNLVSYKYNFMCFELLRKSLFSPQFFIICLKMFFFLTWKVLSLKTHFISHIYYLCKN